MKYKSLLIFLFLSSFVVKTVAQDKMFVVKLKNGARQSYVLKEKPQITFGGSQMIVSVNGGSNSFVLSDIEGFHFENIPASVENVTKNELRFVRVSDSLFRVYGLDGKSRLTVSNINSQTFTVGVKENMAEISLQGFPSGVYIIKAGNQSIKINKR